MSHAERVHRTKLGSDQVQLLVPQFIADAGQAIAPHRAGMHPSLFERLQSVVTNANRFQSPEQRLCVLLHAFQQDIPAAQRGTIYLGTTSEHTFVIGAISPNQPNLVGAEVDVQGGYVEAVAQVKCPALLPDMQQEALTGMACTAQSALVVPFIVGGRTVGVLALENLEQTHAFSRTDLDFASLLSNHTAMIVENARLHAIRPQSGDWGAPELHIIQILAQSIPMGILIVRQNQYHAWGNPTFCSMTGFAQDDLDSHLHQIHRSLAQDVSHLVATTQLEPHELTLLRRDKAPCPVRALIVGFDAIGIRHTKGFVGIFEDLSEESTLKRELFHMQRLSSLDSLMLGVAHELNNPLTAVIGFAELLLARQDIPPESHRDLETIARQAERSIRVSRELLDYLHLTVQEPVRIDVNYVIVQLGRYRMYALETDSIDIEFDLAQPSPQVVGDVQQIQQVLLNLIDNAERACTLAGKKCHLRISTEMVQRGELVRISVRDNGPGIPREIQSRLFEPFFTTEPTGRTTGLGLTVCRQIIALHGGTIWFESEPGQGSTFFIDLPSAHSPEAKPRGDRVAPTSQSTVPPARILVVDDEKSISKLLARVLTRGGHKVDTALDGREALTKLENGIYDIVFLDIKIPILSGQAIFAWIKRNLPSLLRRTVILTGDTLNTETISFLEREHAMRLFKPFQLVDLRNMMDRIWPG
jgi:signal transduction histidine kinase